jgi:PST family polysaccharide transporter
MNLRVERRPSATQAMLLKQQVFPAPPYTSGTSTRRFAANALSLSGIHFANAVIPLLVIPYLSRTLGAPGLGPVLLAQGLGQCVNVFVEYGFALSATRQIARNRGAASALAATLSEVVGAKALLALIASIVSLTLIFAVPAYRDHWQVLVTGVAWGIAQAFNLVWFYQGQERLWLLAITELPTKLLSVLLVYLVVHGAADEWKVLTCLAAGSAIAAIISTYIARCRLPAIAFSFQASIKILKDGWYVFAFRTGSSLFTVSNVLILALFAPAEAVAYYAAAEKLARMPVALLAAFGQLTYPKIANAVTQSTRAASRLAISTAAAMLAFGCTSAAGIRIGAPVLAGMLLGPSFGSVVPLARILAFLSITSASINCLGAQWMLPLGLDRQLTRIIITGGIMNVLIAIPVSAIFGGAGLAWLILTTECLIVIRLVAFIVKGQLSPFQFASTLNTSERSQG